MLDFILYNQFFEILLGIIFLVNVLTILSLDCKQLYKNSQKISRNDIIYKIKITILLVVFTIFIILSVIFFSKYLITVTILITMILSLAKSIINMYKKDDKLTLDDKYYHTFSAILFIAFFASHSVPIYINAFEYETHFTKEILLLLFINLKLILFVFLLLINISVLISNITELLTKKQKTFLKSFLSIESKSYKVIQYDFLLYNKKMCKRNLIIDSVVYAILAPITIVLNTILLIFLKLILKFMNIIKYFINKFNEYKTKRNLVTKKITYISIIVSLFLSYIIVIINNNLFSEITKDLFTYISTVLLIPLIYDSIKSN